ncbi:MAG TPA: hypothetical protein VGN20_27635 [Mucilaginibacter sp.]|jgi:hypothetical protein
MEASEKLTNVQIELLKLFQYNLPEEQLAEIRNILAKYFAKTATDEMDRLWGEKGWDNNTMNNWANEHLRKSDS